MIHRLTALAALIALVPLTRTTAAADKNVTIRYHGQSFFEIISTQGTRIVLDPHAMPEFGGRKVVSADLVLMSHLHDDHTQTGVIENLKQAKVINGVKKGDKNRPDDWNLVDDKVKDVHFRDVGCYHDGMSGMKRGKNSIWVIEVDGLRIVHLGDLGHVLNEAQVKKIGPVDVLLIPVGGIYTINGSDAKEVVEQLKPRHLIIPMHFGFTEGDKLLTTREFLEDQKEGTVRKYDTNELTLDPKARPPQNPRIAVLNFEKKSAAEK
jgi:L-ascorbate metabolism protein UlaG (beta-lactamase superfamily)